MKAKAVVFDLDGTLADTASLTTGYRRPYHVLRLCPPGGNTSQIAFDDGRQDLPGLLITRCYRTAIVTASPLPYASTLCDLLGIDFELLLRAGSSSKARQLLFLSQEWEIAPKSIVYVGDQDVDQAAAREAGCQFVPAHQINRIWHLPDRCEPASALNEIGRRAR